jgi:5-methyltetrahydrofolate--homocysteine methyltransferase
LAGSAYFNLKSAPKRFLSSIFYTFQQDQTIVFSKSPILFFNLFVDCAPSFVEKEKLMAKNEELFAAIIKGKRKDVADLVQTAVDAGTNVKDLLMDSMIPAMREIGDRFSRNEVYVPEMLIAARAMQAGLDIVDPLLSETGHQPLGKVAIGTVKGDLHDIGKNLVAMMVKGAGYEVVDLGVDCDVAKYQEAVDNGTQVLLLSALLTTTMPYMKEVVDHFKATGSDVKILIGGAPITQEYADEIGADGYSADANQAITAVEKVLGL